MAGTVTVAKDGFYGMYDDGVENYISDIKTNCITTAIQALNEKEALYNAIKTGWTGIAEENFEANMDVLIEQVIQSLNDIQVGLEQELRAIAKAWADQDASMVGRV